VDNDRHLVGEVSANSGFGPVSLTPSDLFQKISNSLRYQIVYMQSDVEFFEIIYNAPKGVFFV